MSNRLVLDKLPNGNYNKSDQMVTTGNEEDGDGEPREEYKGKNTG